MGATAGISKPGPFASMRVRGSIMLLSVGALTILASWLGLLWSVRFFQNGEQWEALALGWMLFGLPLAATVIIVSIAGWWFLAQRPDARAILVATSVVESLLILGAQWLFAAESAGLLASQANYGVIAPVRTVTPLAESASVAPVRPAAYRQR